MGLSLSRRSPGGVISGGRYGTLKPLPNLGKIPHGNLTSSHQRLCLQGIVSLIPSSLFLLTPPEVMTLWSLEVIVLLIFHMRVKLLGMYQGLALA